MSHNAIFFFFFCVSVISFKISYGSLSAKIVNWLRCNPLLNFEGIVSTDMLIVMNKTVRVRQRPLALTVSAKENMFLTLLSS